MRERTPSADDTPKRAPPAPSREAASVDVLVDGRSARAVVNSSTLTSSLSSSTERRIRTMVSSANSHDKLGTSQSTINDRPEQQQQQSHHYINHFTNNNNNNHHYSERPGITSYRSAQTAQDKRSRLSNVINNLRKKVPTDIASSITATTTRVTSVDDSNREKDSSHVHVEKREKVEDEARNSVERNLANLEKYVMTVLNGVIKDAESKDEVKNDLDRVKLTSDSVNDIKLAIDTSNVEISSKKDNEDPQTYSPEPSKPNESLLEAAVPGLPEIATNVITFEEKKISKDDKSDNEILDIVIRDSRLENDEKKKSLSDNRATNSSHRKETSTNLEEGQEQSVIERFSLTGESSLARFDNSSIDGAESNLPVQEAQDGIVKDFSKSEKIDETILSSNSDDKRTNNRSLGTLILDRLDHQVINEDLPTDANSQPKNVKMDADSDSEELRIICRDLLNELLNDISQLIEETPGKNEEKLAVSEVKGQRSEMKIDDVKAPQTVLELSNTSIQCSLPLDKVASMLQNCQTPSDAILSACATLTQQQNSKTPVKLPSPTIRHLCLYCDRKFLSISLRQRHTDRVHQLGGGRRSERNSRKTMQNCQYCADKCADNLDSLFHHMIVTHSDKYHACVQCATRYSTRDNLTSHMNDIHGCSSEKISERCDKSIKESLNFKEPAILSTREPVTQSNDRRVEDEQEKRENETTHATSQITKGNVVKDVISNPGSPEFDSSFYSSVSCNIRENLLHHLDGKLQICTSPPGGATGEMKSLQQPQLQTFHDHSPSQIQFPIDISLTAATPVYSKEYVSDEYENSSEYAQKPGKTGRSHPRRVSFEKYNFPRKYDGKEQWTCSIKDLSKFDISTQLSLRKKQQLIKERLTTGKFHGTSLMSSKTTEICHTEIETIVNESENVEDSRISVVEKTITMDSRTMSNERDFDNFTFDYTETSQTSDISGTSSATEFTAEFGNFLRLRKWNECNVGATNSKEVVYAELTGEWSRPRIYICGACASRHLTLREMEEHKATSHPNVWCSHLEFTGDQRELYKHLFVPGRSVATNKAKNAILLEKVCTKCSKICGSLAELHRHMLECGGDQAWLLGLFGNGKKKCKWRPFGSRSRRRRHRGMKRNIQNSQTPRVNQPRERNSSGPRVRPSDRESIQKMLANLPPKRASRRVMQETAIRTQGRLRKMQTRSRPRLVDPIISSSRLSRKAVLRNKLLKNAKSFQRKRCRGDNITAAIESVVKNNDADEDIEDESENDEEEAEEDEEEEEEEEEDDVEDDSGRVFKESRKFESTKSRDETSMVRKNLESSNRSTKIVRGVRVVSKKRNVKSKNPHNAVAVKSRIIGKRRAVISEKNSKNSSKNTEKIAANDPNDIKSLSSNSSSPSHSAISRRKKHVDPVVSLHASLKARSQLRTHDGKFARKVDLKVTRTAGDTRNIVTKKNQILRTRRQEPARLVTRAKLRAARRASNDAKVTRKRLTKKESSENGKIASVEEKEEEKSLKSFSNSSSSVAGKSEKNLSLKGNSGNEQINVEIDLDDVIVKNVIDVTQIKNYVQSVNREQRPTRGRRKKNIDEIKSIENPEISTTIVNSGRESRTKNRSLPGRSSSSSMDLSEESSKRGSSKDSKSLEIKDDELTRKSEKLEIPNTGKKIEIFKPIDTRRARQERRAGSLEDFSKIREVPEEVKRLLGPSDDLLTQIGLKSRDKGKKSNSRQGLKSKINNPKNKGQKKNIVDDEKVDEFVEEPEKIVLRKSPRNAEKKEAKNFEGKKSEIDVGKRDVDKNNEDSKIVPLSDEILQDEEKDTEKVENSLGKRRGRIKSRMVEVDVEKSVEIESEVEAQETTKKFPEFIETIDKKNLEESVEIAVDKNVEIDIVDKNSEESIGNIVDKSLEASIETIVNKNHDRSIDMSVNKNLEESIEIVNKNLEESIENIVDKNLEESIGNIVSKSLEESIGNIVNENLEESIAVDVDKNFEVSIDPVGNKISEESIEKIGNKSLEKSIEKIVNKNLERLTEKIVNKSLEETIARIVNKNFEKSTEVPVNKNLEESIDIAINKKLEESFEMAFPKNIELSIEMAMNKNSQESFAMAVPKNLELPIETAAVKKPEEFIKIPHPRNLELSIDKIFNKAIDQSIVSKHLDESIELAIMNNLDDSLDTIVDENLEESIDTFVPENPEEPIDLVTKNLEESIEIIDANVDVNILESSSKVSGEVATLSFEHLQQESNNSNIDSGKENSSETPMNVSKLKVVRPKKSRGLRRERIGKRTLSNVIGILTEGVNIPVEIQQSVVLTVQTSIEATSDGGTQTNPSQITGSNAAAGEASNIRASVKPNESSDAACSSTESEECQISQEMEKMEIEKLEKTQVDKTEMEKSKENCDVSKNPEMNIRQPEVQPYVLPEITTAAPLPVKPIETFQSVAKEPTNDIILDLSRRKPKGKGSFLEKIVSKIAKQKDALLEGDVGCLLDNAVDELSNILSEVSPPVVEPATLKIDVEKVANQNIHEEKVTKDEKIIVPLKMIVDEIMTNKNEKVPVPIQTIIVSGEKDQSEKEVQPTEEQNFGTRIVPSIVEQFSATLESVTATPESLSCTIEDHEINQSESKRMSKKRSLEATTPKKNKRKTVDEKEIEEDSSDDEMCLADIMKLINRTSNSSPKIQEKSEQKIHSGKRKIMEDDSSSKNSSATLNESEEKMKIRAETKKSKRNNTKKSQICEDSSLDKNFDDEKINDATLACCNENVQLCAEDLSTSSSLIESKAQEKIDEKSMQKSADATKIVQLPVAISIEEKSQSRPMRKCAAKKRSLAEEHLDLSDNEDYDELFPQPIEDIFNIAVADDVATSIVPSTSEIVISTESFKIPEINDFLTTRKRSMRKKSLSELPIENSIKPKNILPEECIEITKKKSDSETREMDCDEKKSEDEIDIVEEKFPVDSISIENNELSKIVESVPSESSENCNLEGNESRKRNLVEDEDETNVEDEEESMGKNLTENSIQDGVESDGAAERRRSLTRKAKETSTPDELTAFSDAKLQRKFAVVHTKSGKMLIVEKKKKFTKEAAKFFCEVCAASFTRKSSLKKHNSSQSHLLQVSKNCDDTEKIGATEEEEVSMIDVSNDLDTIVNNEETKDPLSISSDKEENNENAENDTNNEVNSQELQESQEIEGTDPLDTNEEQECDNSESLTKEPEESKFEDKKFVEDDLEDELLDEEICKITENMTHDEYVLTDHVSPILPEATSTPVNNISVKVPGTPDSIKKIKDTKNEEKMREEEAKINLADEHLILDSPVPDEILAEAEVSNILKECTEKSLYVARTIDIPEIPELTNKSPIAKISPEMIEEKSMKENAQMIEIKVDSSTSIGEDFINERSSRSRRKSKKTIVKGDGPILDVNDIFVPENQEIEDLPSKEIEKSIVSLIAEKSCTEIEESKNEQLEIFQDKHIDDFEPELPENFKQPAKLNSPVVLDFCNITEKLKSKKNSSKEISCSVEFDTDDDNSDTNMSDDIRKILDDPELDTDKKQIEIKSKIPETTEKLVKKTTLKKDLPIIESSVAKKSKQKTKSEEINNKKEKPVKKSSRSKNSSKEIVKKSKTTKPRKNNNSSKTKIEDTSESEYDEQKDVLESQNKSKIVKCVFGRVFGGEKIDKVKEVLDDWVSRSEGDSHDETQTNLNSSCRKVDKVNLVTISPTESKRSRKDEDKSSKVISRSSSASTSQSPERSRGKKRGRSKTSEATSGSEYAEKNRSSDGRRSRSKSGTQTRRKNSDRKTTNDANPVQPSNDLVTSSRCRQSKKRAEERISRAFEDESSIAYDDSELLSELDASVRNSRNAKESREDFELKSISKKSGASSKSKKRGQEEDTKKLIESEESQSDKMARTSLNCSPSSKRERSASPGGISQKVKSLNEQNLPEVPPADDDEDEEEEEEEEEDEDGIALGRLSPFYVCNTPETSIDSSSNSENEENDHERHENLSNSRGRNTSEFINDKVIPMSPTSITSNRDERTEVVTIVPNDAIEDNALDVPRDVVNSPSQKSRQGKVLNFDEELFVECCSRLKATTDNELRGAKKIKLDHTEAYERNNEQEQGFRGSRDRWRDVESQNSLGSLLESVNQLLGEEMYSGNRTNDYPKRGRNNVSERSSRTASPDVDTNRQENLGYEDSLDVAFEHNNKLRVKIQQRMRESENLIASTFGQKTGGTLHRHHHHHHHHHHHRSPNHQRHHENSHNHRRDNRQIEHGRKESTDRSTIVNENLRNGENCETRPSEKNNERSTIDQADKHVELDCSGFRSKNPALGGLLDNLLHSNGKHDHNGSTPMNVLAELACARVPTSTIPDSNSSSLEKSVKSPNRTRESSCEHYPIPMKEVTAKKPRNPIRELFERKKEINERKHHEKIEGDVALKELNVQRQKKSKKPKKQQQQDFPLIRKSQLGGMVEKKKRRDNRKIVLDSGPEKVKDIYDFDDDESQEEPSLVMSYRNKTEKNYDIANCVKTKDLDMTDLMTKTIGEALKNGKSGDVLGRRLESMIDRKFQEIESIAPKTKGALKSFQLEEKQQKEQQGDVRITGPMDDFVERKQRSKKLIDQTSKHGRSKKRGKNSKKKSRNAWYENDSSDEFRTAAKAEDVGVGTTKSQRTCSKGKQNLFAELTTSSESEYENDEIDYEAKRRPARSTKKIDVENRDDEKIVRASPELADNYPEEQEDRAIVDWMNVSTKTDSKNEPEHKKSESEMSDHPLIIDERKIETDETRNSDDDTENRYNPAFELDDLYREDSSVADETEEETNERENERENENSKIIQDEEIPGRNEREIYGDGKDLIPLEEALDLLDNNEDLSSHPERIRAASRCEDSMEKPEESPRIIIEDQSQEKEEIEDECENDCEVSINDEAEEEAELPEKLSSNMKPPKESENLPLHVFLSRKVQESKKRKQQQAKKLQEEQDRILMDFQPTRRQRKCAIGKQGLLAEISSSDDESYARETCRHSVSEKSEERQTRKPKRESKEKRKERYMEKKHEQIIAKEQKAIEEEILRELEKTKGSSTKSDSESSKSETNVSKEDTIFIEKSECEENELPRTGNKKKRQQKLKKDATLQNSRHEAENKKKTSECLSKSLTESKANGHENFDVNEQDSTPKQKKQSKSAQKKKSSKSPETKNSSINRKSKISNVEKTKSGGSLIGKEPKERRSSSGKRDSDDEELRTTRCWNKVDEGVGVAIGRRKRAAANQLYYWSSSSDDDEPIPVPTPIVEEEDDRQEQHGWIVGDSHKRMITMLAMEKQLKEKRRRSEDEFEPGKTKNKKHRNSTS